MKHESNYYGIPVYPVVLLYHVEKRNKNRNRGEANTVLERGCGAGLALASRDIACLALLWPFSPR